MKCPQCDGKFLAIIDNLKKRMGFAHHLELKCTSCDWNNSSYMSDKCQKTESHNNKGRSSFEINVRSIIAFRELGRGFAGVKTFGRCMNMYNIGSTSFANLNNKSIAAAYQKAAEASMKKAAKEIQGDKIGPVCTRVSIDGSWQKRGHASLNGVITAIADDKVVDTQVYSKHCKGCKMWSSHEGTPAYERWKLHHFCHINHKKSSGAMESSGAIAMFNRSVIQNNLIYHEYLGDGDTSSYKEVVEAAPYKEYDITPIKLECIGHVQKRVGTRLRNLVKKYKGTETPMSGKGNLTESIINSLQNFYGMAIRNNTTNMYAMKKAIGAILFHCTKINDPEKRHLMCPQSPDTWCKWQLDKLNSTFTYKDKISIPMWIHTKIRPVFQELSDDSLLQKCLHGQTQNANEAFNAIIWTRCPKGIFVSRTVFSMAVNSAILHFNDGSQGLESVFEQFGLKGTIATRKSLEMDTMRVKQMKRKSTDVVKKQRKKLRTIKKGYIDKEKQQEKQESYIPGGF